MAETSPQRYYSPSQIGVAAFIGGPLASGYLAARNHTLFAAQSKATITLLVSIAVFVALIALGFSLANDARATTTGAILAATIAALYRLHAQAAFGSEITRLGNEGWTRHSWWRVIGLSLAILATVFVCAFIVVLLTGIGTREVAWADRAEVSARSVVEQNAMRIATTVNAILHPEGKEPTLASTSIAKVDDRIVVDMIVSSKDMFGQPYQADIVWEISKAGHVSARLRGDSGRNDMFAYRSKAEALDAYFRTQGYPAFHSAISAGNP